MAAIKKIGKRNGYGEKVSVKIITVDKDKRRVECAMRDGAMIYAAIWETGTVFRWPEVGETWTVRQDTGIWRLDKQVQNELGENESNATPKTLAQLPEGDTRIIGSTVHVNGMSSQALTVANHQMVWIEAVPTKGKWNIGDIAFNSAPKSGGFVGWVCVASGEPGTWKTFGLIS